MKIVRDEVILLWVSIVFLPACSPQTSEGPEATAAAETPDSAVHSPATEHGGGPVHWSYGEDDGPTRWAALSSDYVACASGREQSPIDIAGAATGESMQMSKDYKAGSLKIIRQEHVDDYL